MMNSMYVKALFLLSLAGTLTFTSCSQDDDDTMDDTTDLIEIEDNVQSGNWRVAEYIDSGEDETDDFSDFVFTFAEDGTVSAINGSEIYQGNWSITDSSSDDDSPEDVDFNIFFNVDDDHEFEDLNDDWDIITYSSTRIELRDISGGDGDIDLLTFEKL